MYSFLFRYGTTFGLGYMLGFKSKGNIRAYYQEQLEHMKVLKKNIEEKGLKEVANTKIQENKKKLREAMDEAAKKRKDEATKKRKDE